jgi:hypothetical protein
LSPPYSSAQVETALYRAGRTLMALRVDDCWPIGFRSSMPDVLREAVVAYGHVRATFRVSPPAPSEISAMDQAFSWVGLLAGDDEGLRQRRVVWARCLVDPRDNLPLYSWRTIGAPLGVSHVTARSMWHRATQAIAGRLNAPGLCSASGGPVGPSRRVSLAAVARAVREFELA